jgi:hypothetical protein
MQDVLYAFITSPDVIPKDAASCTLAWERLEERKRILRGKPMPGSLKPESPKPKRKTPSVVEPTELP